MVLYDQIPLSQNMLNKLIEKCPFSVSTQKQKHYDELSVIFTEKQFLDNFRTFFRYFLKKNCQKIRFFLPYHPLLTCATVHPFLCQTKTTKEKKQKEF